VSNIPKARIGNKISLDRKQFLELKGKNEKIKIRIASADYYYEGKHFTQKENSDWVVTNCIRVNDGLDCITCEEYFELAKQLKELKSKDKKDEGKIKELDKEAGKYKPKISFYYPVLDRGTGLAGIFRTSLMVRLALEEKIEEGVDVLKVDFVVKRTEKPGSYYTLTRVDSSETPKLTKEEKVELEKAREINMEDIVSGKKGKMSFEPNEEVETKEATDKDETIPF